MMSSVLCSSDCISDVCFFVKQKTAYEMRISDWSSDVCSSDLSESRQSRGSIEHLGPLVRCAPGHFRPHRQQPLTVAVVRLAAVAPADQRGARHADAQGDRLEGQVVRALDVGDDAEPVGAQAQAVAVAGRSEEHTSELQSLMRNSYAVF